MRRIVVESLTEAFSRGAFASEYEVSQVPVYIKYRKAFNATTTLTVLAALLFVAAIIFWSKQLFVFSLCFVLLYLYCFYRTRIAANALVIRRSAPSHAQAMSEIEVELEVFNLGRIPVSGLKIREHFLGSMKPFVDVFVEVLPPHTRKKIKYTVLADGGMGVFGFEPTRAKFGDGLGLTFARIEDSFSKTTIEIFPKVPHLPDIELRSSPQSVHYGLKDVPTPSVSVNFNGIREYKLGDSLRHISWRISARHQSLFVKEFEKNVNDEVTVVIDMDARKHVGIKLDSTWETQKQLALGLVSQQVSLGSAVQLISQTLHIPFGRGEAQSKHTIVSLSRLEPQMDTSETNLLMRSLPFYPPHSQIFYLSTCFLNQFSEETENLNRLQSLGFQVYAFLIEPDSFVPAMFQKSEQFSCRDNSAALRNKEESQLFKVLSAHGVSCYWINKASGLRKPLFRPQVRVGDQR